MRQGLKYGIIFLFGQLYVIAKTSNDTMGMIASVFVPMMMLIYELLFGDSE